MTRIPALIVATTIIPHLLATNPHILEHHTRPSLPDRKQISHPLSPSPRPILRRSDGDIELMECGYLPRTPLPSVRHPISPIRAPRRPSSSSHSFNSTDDDELGDPDDLDAPGPSSPDQQEALRKARVDLREHQRQLQRIWRQGNQSPVFRRPASLQTMAPEAQMMRSEQELDSAVLNSDAASLGRSTAISPNSADSAALATDGDEGSETAQREVMRTSSFGSSVRAQCIRCVRGCLGGFVNATDAMIDYCEDKCGQTGFKCAVVIAGCIGLVGTLAGSGVLLNELAPQ